VAKLLGLGYPGGPIIEKVARGACSIEIRFPRALMDKEELDFSFSGLKTSVLRKIQEIFGTADCVRRPGSFHPLVSAGELESAKEEIQAVAAGFQDAVIDALVVKGLRCAARYGCAQLVVCGGVAANRALRDRMMHESARSGVEAIFPAFNLCTDNAAMIGARADTLLCRGIVDDLNFDAKSRW